MKETLGRAADGWTKRRAEQALRARLTDVEREGYVRPDPLTVAAFADRFLVEHVPGRNLKRSTVIDYRLTIERHLKPLLGDVELVELSRRPELVERYTTAKLADGLSPKTIRKSPVAARAHVPCRDSVEPSHGEPRRNGRFAARRRR